MLLFIILAPFIGFLINATLGRRLTKAVSGGVAVAAMLVAFGLSLAAAPAFSTAVRGGSSSRPSEIGAAGASAASGGARESRACSPDWRSASLSRSRARLGA